MSSLRRSRRLVPVAVTAVLVLLLASCGHSPHAPILHAAEPAVAPTTTGTPSGTVVAASRAFAKWSKSATLPKVSVWDGKTSKSMLA